MQFEELNLIAPLLRAVEREGYATPTPIQEMAIPHVLAGRDLMGCAQTGTGKTAAFVLPILQRLHGDPTPGGARIIRTLVLAPTRELAAQIAESFAVYGSYLKFRHAVLFGGVSQHNQTRALDRGVDILVATPGRLLDLMNQGFVDLKNVDTFVLDEGDRMLDMGFIPDIRRIVKALPKKRQTLLFSATLPIGIRELESGILNDPIQVAATPSATTVENVEQTIYFVEKINKTALLAHLLRKKEIKRVLVFTRTRHGADSVIRNLSRGGGISADAIHGEKSQGQRERSLEAFKQGKTRVLVATDIASRGLDIDDVTHVVNFDLPHDAESYVHRIGRTARAGSSGAAISFCTSEDGDNHRAIEKLIKKSLIVVNDHPYPAAPPVPSKPVVVFSNFRRGSARRLTSRPRRTATV